VLEDKDDDGEAIREFLEDGGDDERAKADGIGGDEEKSDLPSEGSADKAVKEAGMGDRWGILAADEIEHEIEGRDDEQAPDGSNPEDDFGKLHANLPERPDWTRKLHSRLRMKLKCEPASGLGDNVGVTRDFPPLAIFVPPDDGNAEKFCLARIGHLASPSDGFAACENHDVPVDVKVLNLTIKSGDDQKARLDHTQDLLLIHELVERIGDDKLVGPQVGQGFWVFIQKGLNFKGAETTNFGFGALVGLACGGGLRGARGDREAEEYKKTQGNRQEMMHGLVPP